MAGHPPPRKRNQAKARSIPGQVESHFERMQEIWTLRTQGLTYQKIAAATGLGMGTIYRCIDEARTLVLDRSTEMAERERDQALALIDNAIEKVVPHINGDIEIKTVLEGSPRRPPVVIRVEEWQARMKGCQVLVSLLDRKAKLLGMDAPVRVEPPPTVAPETPEQRARAREALRVWTRFAVDPKDFQAKDLGASEETSN
jgi:hypothetical protein